MKDFLSKNFSKLTILESVSFCLKKIKTDYCEKFVFSNLKKKICEAKNYLEYEKNSKNRLKKLLKLFYSVWKFREIDGKYNLSDVLLLDNVLKTYRGTAISLGIILLYVAKKLNISLNPIIFPTQIILKSYFSDKKKILINPFNGEILENRILDLWLKGNISSTVYLNENYLKSSKSKDVLKKFLNILKSSLMEERKIELALKVSNVLLKISPNDPYERRDRGLIYSQLECYQIAIEDLSYFVYKCPEDPIVDIIKLKIQSIKHNIYTLH
ncbi:transglutaminase family protein [Buchnera aphidicola]|uniref:transglutaminase family protein n=1 Tax=Buchnera aphidicola TaxID=9 RepID=UPI002542EB96|nr:tetratricopeptide repeat protein [Buchnera aphidicola]WII23801.1 tetratricopeptide repeat protein [Buchnera aphidicola (Sipha maydis)]